MSVITGFIRLTAWLLIVLTSTKSDATQVFELRTVNPAEANMTSVEIIISRGYPVEVHSVVTADGYILELHRIPHRKGSTAPPGKPVFLQHGLGASDADWLISPSEHNLAFRLVDTGYDVWLGNSRGNVYSRRHTFLNTEGKAYWKFSWDELGRYDIPAVIEYILAKSGQQKISYIGFSLGCAMFFIAMIHQPELNSKIEMMIALAPATTIANTRSSIRYLGPYVRLFELGLVLLNTREFQSDNDVIRKTQSRICGIWKLPRFCENLDFVVINNDLTNIDPKLLPVIDGHTPKGTSLRVTVQLIQNYNSGQKFVPYSYGRLRNLLRYGRFLPPPYDLTKVTSPVYMFYGKNDVIVDPKDVTWLAKQLVNLKELIGVDLDSYNHYDFLWATENNRLLYDLIISLLPKPL